MSKSFFLATAFLFAAASSYSQKDSVSLDRAKFNIGKTVKVCGTITDARLKGVSKDESNVLFTGDDYNHRTLALIFTQDALRRFSYNPNEKMINHAFCATGKIVMYEGKPGMYIKNENQLNVSE